MVLTIVYQENLKTVKCVLIIGGGSTDDIIDSIGESKKEFRINFTNSKSKFCLTLLQNAIFMSMEHVFINLKYT